MREWDGLDWRSDLIIIIRIPARESDVSRARTKNSPRVRRGGKAGHEHTNNAHAYRNPAVMDL